ncbi:hypothetical protein ASG31_14000 [Chryseobacterium sp. Leaf404]|uniref:hypothetical protein n=1 Tax=unclassified Chryseobacterium TaxID=2593645 RepID=UPI0006FA5002|nr:MULTISPECIES: hypothetical protein [unclassified Chryseobacterium]KQT16084.1 hypothetical protein ASG31_14000 [Chryseobacterium sp. Leaf404]
METTIEILKKKIDILSPDLVEALSKILNTVETQDLKDISQFQMDEISYRIYFHSENPNTKLDFFENIDELEHLCA